MIITEPKPEEELKGYLEGIGRVFIIGCGSCATKCETGGEEQVKAMADKLREWGVKVTGWAVPEECCDYRFLRRDVLRPHKEAVASADALLVMACGSGVQAVAEVTGKMVIPALNTNFIGITERLRSFHERCRACGDCLLFYTGGICPVARCAKGLLNGPCGGQANGKCEATQWQTDCAWVLIYERLKEQGRLDLFKKLRLPKDWSEWSKPRERVWR